MNEDKINQFLENKELSVDSIFNEILELYGIDEITRLINLPCTLFENIEEENEFNNLLFFDENFINIDILNENQLLLNEKNIIQQAKIKAQNMHLTPEKINAMKQKQLQVNQQLQAELYRNINNSRNNDYCVQAAKNPQQFMSQNINSIQAIPKDMRKDILKPNIISDKKTLGQKIMEVWGKINKINIYMIAITSFIPGLVSYRTSEIDIGINNPEFSNSGKVVKGFTVIRMMPNLIQEIITMILKGFDYAFGTDFKSGMASQTVKFGDIQFSWTTGGTAVMWISLGLTFIPLIWNMTRNVNKKNKEIRKKEYAQTHQMVREDITDEMLYENDKEYYEEMKLLDEIINFDQFEVLNEGLFDWVKRILPTPKNLLRLVNKGFLMLTRFAKAIEEGLKLNSISPFMAQFYNIILSIGNILLTIVKGILLPLARFVGNDTKKIEVEHIQQKEAIQNGGA